MLDFHELMWAYIDNIVFSSLHTLADRFNRVNTSLYHDSRSFKHAYYRVRNKDCEESKGT